MVHTNQWPGRELNPPRDQAHNVGIAFPRPEASRAVHPSYFLFFFYSALIEVVHLDPVFLLRKIIPCFKTV